MLSALDIHEIGEIIRKVRKEKGLRLEDLADKNISPATISNIERGIPHVNPQRATYLLQKLDIRLEDIPNLMVQEKEALHDLKFKLFAIESTRDAGNPDQALRQLKGLQVDDSHPYAAKIYYLLGTCLNKLTQFERAQRLLFDAIRLSNQNPYGKKNNIAAASFYELGLNSYHHHRLEQALAYVENGLEAFVDDGEGTHLKFKLIENKAVYLEHLERVGEALKIIEDHWDAALVSQHIDTILGFYTWRSELLSRLQQYDAASAFCLAGIEIARINKQHNRLFNLWTILANIHMSNSQWKKAEECFQVALTLKSSTLHQKDLAHAHMRLSTLYIQQERWEKSLGSINQAISLYKLIKDMPRLADALTTLGKYYCIQKNRHTAITHFQEALDIAHKYHLLNKKVDILFLLARCWENIDRKQFQLCLNDMYKVKHELTADE
ncbi:Helix-turn-helix [Marininema mesophilum]|uniref:Helix-turn-helix n=1 Tax=Marininema mesophilum TaxID=1048340 RepID=A0A1H3C2D9_9BACL|nr:tetratricopeptide repeat protein [Marininema mesophilum]SDX48266.1 Helix-turn-helix [Marininema mesophilum]